MDLPEIEQRLRSLITAIPEPGRAEVLRVLTIRDDAQRAREIGHLHRSGVLPETAELRAVSIAYGYATSEMAEEADRGEVVLGGCVIGLPDGDASWACRSCGFRFGRPETSRDDAHVTPRPRGYLRTRRVSYRPREGL